MHSFGRQERRAANRVLASGRLFRYMPGATEAVTFEAELAAWVGTSHAVLVSSGTAALICALAASGIGPDDEVLIPAYGFVADVLAPLAVGAVPVVCEIDDTLTLDVEDLERKITSRTRAVLAVHMNGFPAAMSPINDVAARHGLAVIEDACQGLGGTYAGQPLGSIGDIGAFSFNQYKLLTSGEGGAVVTSRRDLYERAFITHDGSCNFMQDDLETPMFAGLAFRASELTAAILRAQLAKADAIVAGLRKVSATLSDALDGFGEFEPIPCHDRPGVCGTHVACRFADARSARRFLDVAADSGLPAGQGVGFGHAFAEWGILHERRGGLHPKRNPLLGTTAALDCDACPRTADVLARTVLIWCNLELSDHVVRSFARRLRKSFT